MIQSQTPLRLSSLAAVTLPTVLGKNRPDLLLKKLVFLRSYRRWNFALHIFALPIGSSDSEQATDQQRTVGR